MRPFTSDELLLFALANMFPSTRLNRVQSDPRNRMPIICIATTGRIMHI